ncbi:hypothetical protein GCK72_025051 [Caenorhabditis remanei]|uniref:Uncharacterized protein n=2 Tax=Caenorhabditis remanei TaxID=31234 RepID=E3MRV2_CAERE|nr:hypothetical protein GCK72_025051 [Caenorhabditis remanei]EFP07987.1 hypothetical protein CRE_14770 [Caenorhabditis remanei]KAF1748584.1 hypothetical protein GCK72_025051 [Caenorhabditis remanei]
MSVDITNHNITMKMELLKIAEVQKNIGMANHPTPTQQIGTPLETKHGKKIPTVKGKEKEKIAKQAKKGDHQKKMQTLFKSMNDKMDKASQNISKN